MDMNEENLMAFCFSREKFHINQIEAKKKVLSERSKISKPQPV